MKILSLLLILGAVHPCHARAAMPVPTPAQPKHKKVDGKLPPDSGALNKTKGAGQKEKGAETEHAVDKRFAKTVRSTDKPLVFPGDEAADTDTRPCEGKHTLETYFELTSQTEPQAAKDGGVYFLAESLDPAAGRQLFHQSLPDTKPKAITRLAEGVRFYRVSPDGKKILVASGDGKILLFTSKGGEPVTLITGEHVPAVAWSPDSSWFAYTSDARNHLDLDLYRKSVAGGAGQRLSDMQGLHVVSDVSPDAQAIALTEIRSATDSDVLVWTAQGVTNTTRSSSGALSFGGRFTRDGHGLFALSDAERGIAQLYRFSLAGGTPKPMTSEATEVDAFTLDDARSALIYRVNEEGYSRLGGWGIDQRGNKTTLLDFPKFPRVVVSLPTFTAGSAGAGFYYARTSLTKPSVIWKWLHPYHQPMLKVTDSPLPRRCFSAEELVHYPSFDGRPISAFLLAPKNPGGNPPYLIFAHDGPDAQFRPAFDGLVQYFAERGYGVLAPNVRGSTGYGRDFASRDDRHKREDAVKDILAGAKFLVDNRYARNGRIALYGEAYGGYLALRALEINNDLFAGAAAAIPFLDLGTFLSGVASPWRAYQQEEFGGAAERAYLGSVSPLANSKQLKKKVQLFTVGSDPRVPQAEAEAFAKGAVAPATVELHALGRVAPTASRWLDLDGMRHLGYFLDGLFPAN